MILLENQILDLLEIKEKHSKQVENLKDLMRKYREKQLKINDKSSYFVFNNNIPIKKSSKELYPFLEKQLSKFTNERNKA